MGKKYSFLDLTSDSRSELEDLARRPAGFWVISSTGLPSAIPAGLAGKVTAAVVIVSSQPSGNTVVVINNHRPDPRAWAIDQEPFGAMIYDSGCSTGALMIHHGQWEGRTIPAPAEFWDQLSNSTVPDHFPPTPGLPVSSQGALSELYGTSHAAAVDQLLRRLEQRSESA